MKHSLTILTLLALVPLAEAKGIQSFCSDIDILKLNPRIQLSEPVSQLNAGWCYAFVASDLISAETGQPISQAYTMALYNRWQSENVFLRTKNEFAYRFSQNKPQYRYTYEGGNVQDAIRSVVKKKSACSEQSMPYTVNLNFIEGLDTLQTKIRSTNYQLSQEDLKEVKTILGQHNFANSDPQEVLNNLRTKNLNMTYEKVLEENCKEFIAVGDYQTVTLKKPKLSLNVAKYLNVINSILESGKPIGIAYNSGLIKQSGNGAHAGLITARRFNKDRCEYKIRNTWGKSCDHYRPEIDCVKDEGAYWISDNNFMQMLIESYYIK